MVAAHTLFPLTSAALKNLTYPHPNLKDFTLDYNDLERTIPLDNGRHQLDPKADLGMLEKLPLEILNDVLIQIDLESLSTLRRVNQRAMQIIDTIPQYRAILQHSPASLRGILAIKTGPLVSCQKLFCALVTATCVDCGDFGGFIYLFTGTRVCFLCLSEDAKYLPLLASEVRYKFGICHRVATALPHMRSLPGCYSPNQKTCRTRLNLYDYKSACRAAEKYHGSATAMDQHVAGCVPRKGDDPIPRRIPRLLDGKSSNPKRFMAIVRAPWLSPLTRLPEWGFHCIGCERAYRARPLHWRRKYFTPSFEKHFQECEELREKASSMLQS